MNKKTISTILILLGIAIGAAFVSSEKDQKANNDTFKIGGAFALTGDIAPYGEADRNGAQLAVNEINAAGGVNGKKIELLVQDTRSTAKDTVSAFLKLKSIDGAKYFMVSFADTYPGTESLVDSDELFISPDAGVEVMNGKVMHKNVFGTWYRTQPKSELAVRHMAETGRKKLYLVVNNDGYYATVVDYMKKAAEKYGVQVVGVDMLGENADAKGFLPKVKASGADALFFGVLDNSLYIDFLKRKQDFLKGVAIYGDETVTQYLVPDYLSLVEGMYFYVNIEPPKKFVDDYKAAFGINPEITASVSYDTVYIMAEAMKDQPKDIDAYMRSRSFKTVSYGTVTFDEIGGIKTDSKYFVMKQVRDGKGVEVLK